jgi:hypothetical protein
VSRNPYEEEQWTGSKYIIKPANYKSFDVQNKFILYFSARNFAQCTRTLTLCSFGNETNLHILLSACISVERSAEHRFQSGLPAVGAAPLSGYCSQLTYAARNLTLSVTSGFWDRIHALGYLHRFDQHNLRICGQKDGQTDRWVYYDVILWIRNAEDTPLTIYELLYCRFI